MRLVHAQSSQSGPGIDMPNGGQLSQGSGLRLQLSSPGVQDAGNGNISGVMIAGQFTTSANGIGVSGNSEIFGHGLTRTVKTNQVTFGISNTIVNTQNVAMGIGNATYPQSSVAIGFNCLAGSVGDGGASRVAIGVVCNSGDNNSSSQTVAMGAYCTANGGRNTALGNSVQMSSTNIANADMIGIGDTITFNNINHREILAIGRQINQVTAVQNSLVVGYYGGGLSGLYPGVVSNQIMIGNRSQTSVLIGPYTIGQSTGVASGIADANAVATANDGELLYTSITAPRTVTLAAAASVPLGFRLLIADASGTASGVNTITPVPSGADTLVGASGVINAAYGNHEIMSDGVSKWIVIR